MSAEKEGLDKEKVALPGKSTVYREIGVVVVHVLKRCCWSCFTEIDEFVGAVRATDEHEAAAANAGMIHS